MQQRRTFLHTAALTAAAGLCAPPRLLATSADRWGDLLPRRKLGSTGLSITLFGAGGAHLCKGSEKEVATAIDRCIELGCRFFDTAATYQNGRSEELFGKLLCPKYREEILLLSKSRATTAKEMRADVEQSLKRLGTDRIDVYFLHWIASPDDVETRIKGGAYDELIKLKAEQKILHAGFSCHSDPAAATHLLAKNLDLEVAMLAMNVVDPSYHSFIRGPLPLAINNDVGVIAMKVLAGGGLFGGPAPWGRNQGENREALIPAKLTVRQAHHYALSLPVSSVVSGMTKLAEIDENLGNARAFGGMTAEQRAKLERLVSEFARDGAIEHYKFT